MYKSAIWDVEGWDEQRLKQMKEQCENYFVNEEKWLAVSMDRMEYYAEMYDVVLLKLMCMHRDSDKPNVDICNIFSPNNLYLAVREAINWCKVNKSSKCGWVLDIPDEFLKKLSPQQYILDSLAANNPQIDELIENLELTTESDVY